MNPFKICTVLYLLLFSFAVNGQVTFEPDSVFTYKTTKQGVLKMNVFKPENHTNLDQRPTIVFFFGGGWVGGTPKQFYQQAKFFADHGFLAISAEYRVFNKHKTSPFESVSDGKSAIRFLREHANILGIDSNKIIASGGSAGGHVAACTGVINEFDEIDENLKISSIPNAMILFNPVIDTTEKGYGIEKVGVNRKTEISPCSHVVSGIPPALIFHGTADTTVPFENVERFTRLMIEKGNVCDLVSFKGKRHGFFNGSYFRKKKTDTVFNETMHTSLIFIKNI